MMVNFACDVSEFAVFGENFAFSIIFFDNLSPYLSSIGLRLLTDQP